MQTPRYKPKRNENTGPHKNQDSHTPSSIIPNSQKEETAQMSTNELMGT